MGETFIDLKDHSSIANAGLRPLSDIMGCIRYELVGGNPLAFLNAVANEGNKYDATRPKIGDPRPASITVWRYSRGGDPVLLVPVFQPLTTEIATYDDTQYRNITRVSVELGQALLVPGDCAFREPCLTGDAAFIELINARPGSIEASAILLSRGLHYLFS